MLQSSLFAFHVAGRELSAASSIPLLFGALSHATDRQGKGKCCGAGGVLAACAVFVCFCAIVNLYMHGNMDIYVDGNMNLHINGNT